MNPVLIYTDTKRINDEQATIANVVVTYQAIYNAIKAAGVTNITLAEIDSLVQNAKRQSQSSYVNDYVLNKLAAQVGTYAINGVTMTAAFVKSGISLPDTSAITAALLPVTGGNAQRVFIGSTNGARLNLLTLAADVISAVSDANAQITALYTYYTASDASATLATQLQAVCDAMNAFNTANGGVYIKRVPVAQRNSQGDQESEIPGLAVSGANSNYIISLAFIRKFEQLGTVFFG